MAIQKQIKTTAEDYFISADGHHQAILIVSPKLGEINKTGGSVPSLFLAFHNLIGFTLELYLKAYLCGRGISSDVLSKKPFGHDLRALYDEAVTRGLSAQPSLMDRIVSIYGPNHGDYTYRYMRQGQQYEYIENLEYLFIALQQLKFEIGSLSTISSS